MTLSFPTFVQVKVALAAAVAQNGTFTVAYPTGYNIGSFAGSRNHKAYVEGLQAYVTSPTGFTISAGATLITVTWLGATSIPANTSVFFEFETIGAVGRADPYAFQLPQGSAAGVVIVSFGAPKLAITTDILNVTAVADALLHTLATPYVMDVPRNVTYVSSTTDTTQTITLRGFDVYGVAMTEVVTLTGATPVIGKKAFAQVVSYQASILLAGNLSLGFGAVLGMPVLLSRKRYVFAENVDDATLTTGTFVVGDAATPSGTTGDVRGTYAAATAFNGAHIYELIVACPERVGQMAQYAG